MNMATPVPVPLPDPDNHSLSIYGSSVYPCQVPGPVSLSHCSYFASHRLRNTPESKHNSSHFPGSFSSPPPSSDVLPLRRCCQPAGTTSKRGPTLSRSLSPHPLSHVPPRKKKKTLPQAFFFFSLFPQPVMGLVPHSEYSSDRSVGRASLSAVTTVIGRARVAPS
jgi:hypothetical protein